MAATAVSYKKEGCAVMSQGRKDPTERGPHELLAEETSAMLEEATAMIGEVSKVLQTRRWETRDGPFTGFRSPPGRF